MRDSDKTTETPSATADAVDETELARRAGEGDKEAFDLLYDRYFARTSWYFTIFARREARKAVTEVLTELFGSLGTPSDLSFGEQAYRLAREIEVRHTPVAEGRPPDKSRKPAKVATAKSRAAKADSPRLRP